MSTASVIDRYVRAYEAYLALTTDLTVELGGSTPEHLLAATVSKRIRENHTDIYDSFFDAKIAHDQAFAALREREVAAQELAVSWAKVREQA